MARRGGGANADTESGFRCGAGCAAGGGEGEEGEGVIRWASVRRGRTRPTLRANFDCSGPLLIGFPVGFFEGDFVVGGGGLDAAFGVDAAGDEGVLAGGDGAEVEREEA